MKEKNDEIYEIIKKVAPGTAIREGLDNILKAGTGGLVVVSESEEIMDIADGGFKINDDYSPSKIYELAKMDNAIIISEDTKKIGFELIDKELEKVSNPKAKELAKQNVVDIKASNRRDFRF